MSGYPRTGRHRHNNKFGAIRTACLCGMTHPSKAQAKRCQELTILERAGEIADLRREVAYPLVAGGLPILLRSEGYPNGRQAKMTWDFAYTDKAGPVVDDTKGEPGRDFALRLAVFQACYPNIRTRLNGVDTPGQGA